MRQGIVTIVTPIKAGLHEELRNCLRGLNSHVFSVLHGLHFASLSVIDNHADEPGAEPFVPHLVFEASFDGTREDFVDELVALRAALLDAIYAFCEGYPQSGTLLPQPVRNYLLHHDVGADALYVAAPGRTVHQIRHERHLRDRLRELDRDNRATVPHRYLPPPTARSRVSLLRRQVAQAADLQGALTLPERPFVVTYGGTIGETVLRAILGLVFIGLVVWIYRYLGDTPGELLLPAVLLGMSFLARLIAVWRERWNRTARLLLLAAVITWLLHGSPMWPDQVIEWVVRGIIGIAVAVRGIVFWLAVIVIVWIVLFVQLQESFDTPDPTMPSWDSDREEAIRRLENVRAQNHMVGLNRIKEGWVRRITVRVVLWVIHVSKHLEKSGLLSGVSTIHFARWVVIDKGRQVLFLSHYDGDWDAYLGDFVTQASRGLTAIWSNCVGFPRAWFLFFGGASDERVFKAYARKHQHETLCVYSAYPDLTVVDIENQTAIREALGRSLDAAGVDALLRRL